MIRTVQLLLLALLVACSATDRFEPALEPAAADTMAHSTPVATAQSVTVRLTDPITATPGTAVAVVISVTASVLPSATATPFPTPTASPTPPLPPLQPSPSVTPSPVYTATPTPAHAIVYDADTVCSAVTDMLDGDCHALVALFNATWGFNWYTGTGWMKEPLACTWYGVTCADGRVVTLTLTNNNLGGQLPPEIGALDGLTALYLAQNGLSGALPVELGRLPRLETLWLTENQLSGEIPAELGNAGALRSLALGQNRLSGALPPEVGRLTNLGTLYLDENDLSGPLPIALFGLTGLVELHVRGNQLSGPIAPQIGNLTRLVSLDLAGNRLSGALPVEIAALPDLYLLRLFGNQFSGELPRTFADRPQLQEILFYDAGLCVPDDAALRAWLAARRFAYGTPVQNHSYPLCDGTVVTPPPLTPTPPPLPTPVVLAYDCSVVISIPAAECDVLLSLYQTLNGIWWQGATNWLQNDDPCTWHAVLCAGGHIDGLVFDGSEGLSGALPTVVTQLPALRMLSLAGNLSGELPAAYYQMTRLQALRVISPAFYGTVMPDISRLRDLRELVLIGAGLTGVLPVELTLLPDLSILEISHTGIGGVLPEGLGNLASLSILRLRDNSLSGPPPDGIGRLSGLRVLDIGDNPMVEGPLPASWLNLTLRQFYFSNTGLCVPTGDAWDDWLAAMDVVQGDTRCAQ